eukprot:jgi/Tetstr1/422751/TSEL_013548.t1
MLDDLVLKLRQSGAAPTVVALAWHDRPWMPQLHDLATEVLHCFRPSHDLFFPRLRGERTGIGPPRWSVLLFRVPFFLFLHAPSYEDLGINFTVGGAFSGAPSRAPTPLARAIARDASRAFQPYLSAVNAFLIFFHDHLREPVAVGPLVNQAVNGGKFAQVDTRVAGIRVPLQVDVAFRLRIGRASADSAAGVPLPKIYWLLGDWVDGSIVVHTYIVPGYWTPPAASSSSPFWPPSGRVPDHPVLDCP